MTDISPFALAVYQVVAAIPAGRVASYGEIARQAGHPRRARQVGRLLRHLPKDSRLPWHRVLRADGTLALAGTQTGELQRQRLHDEGVGVLHKRVPRQYFWQGPL